ncbi:MAG: hypothetical protein M1282_09980 [Chloroflexi bacterium]|nr:hypothetical protein [Chloroflexota bacterium]
MTFKNIVSIILQWLGAFVGFLVCLVIANLILPLPKNIMDAAPASGFLSAPLAFVFNGAVNATILIWAARRSSFKGFAMWFQLFILSFGVQTFETQIETAYFISAFPLLHGNFEVYHLILRGLITSFLFTLLVTSITGGFSRKPREANKFEVNADHAVKVSAWLAVVYIALYMLFGYFVAWQSQELRLFYGGPAQLNSFVDQWATTLMGKPELPVFQYFRGVIWILCLIPLFKGFTGKRVELIVVSALALGLLPTAQLAFANPLMPAGVSYYHFWEVSISTGIFGALCAWFVPKEVKAA